MFGVAKIGEKGQVVIPSGAREKIGLRPGDEIVLFGSCKKHFVVGMKEEYFREFLAKFGEKIERGMDEFGDEKSEMKIE